MSDATPTLRMAGHRYACWASMRLDKQRGDKVTCICELATDPESFDVVESPPDERQRGCALCDESGRACWQHRGPVE